MVAQFPASSNVYVKSHEASGKMIVDFSRNTKDWAVNKYCQLIPVKKDSGYYAKMTVEVAGRILNADLSEFDWPDGQPARANMQSWGNTESFEFLEFKTRRRKHDFTIGYKTADQASWDIIAQHARIHGQACMTARTQLAITAATTAGNYPAAHTSAVASISGVSGNWAASTTARMDIKRSLEHACETILDSTLAAINLDDLCLVISTGLAKELSLTQEIVDYIKGSPDALAQVRGELPNDNVFYGLPAKLYGVPLVVEKTRKVTSAKGATRVVAPILADSTPFITARPGELEAPYSSAPSFSTLTMFVYEDMSVESKDDSDDRLHYGRVVDDIALVVTAPVSGFLFTSAV